MNKNFQIFHIIYENMVKMNDKLRMLGNMICCLQDRNHYKVINGQTWEKLNERLQNRISF